MKAFIYTSLFALYILFVVFIALLLFPMWGAIFNCRKNTEEEWYKFLINKIKSDALDLER